MLIQRPPDIDPCETLAEEWSPATIKVQLKNLRVMNIVKNSVTGVSQFNVNGTLKTMGTKVLELKNEKKTKYRLCTVEITVKGQKRLVTAQIWEKSVKAVKEGETYTCTASIMDGGRILFQLNSIQNGEVMTLADFGVAPLPAEKEAKVS